MRCRIFVCRLSRVWTGRTGVGEANAAPVGEAFGVGLTVGTARGRICCARPTGTENHNPYPATDRTAAAKTFFRSNLVLRLIFVIVQDKLTAPETDRYSTQKIHGNFFEMTKFDDNIANLLNTPRISRQ
jgi:hypothetical protein